MDWFSWLSKTSLEPSLVYDYALVFSENELEEEDIGYFDHEFLQSMGISIAKHRLEILKIAKKEKGGRNPIMRLFIAIKRTNRCLAKYIQSLVHREDSAIVVMPRGNSYSSRWKMAMLKRNKKMMMSKQGRFLITNGGYSSNPLMVQEYIDKEEKEKMNEKEEEEEDENSKEDEDEDEDEEKAEEGLEDESYWCSGVEEIKWDTMFQNMKPT